jgi:hypothetical protein
MSRKSVLKSYKMLDVADISVNVSSSATSVINLDKASIHLKWSGTAVGEISVMARNGELDPWYELDFGQAINITSGPGEHQIVFNELPFTDIRLDYASTSGAGTLDATISAKVVGA